MFTSSQASKTGKLIITIYPIVGRQLFFDVPKRICEECDLTIRVMRQVIEEIGKPAEIDLQIRPWLNYLPQALLRGGWHPPVVVIDGKLFSQGIVPDPTSLREAITQSLLTKESQDVLAT